MSIALLVIGLVALLLPVNVRFPRHGTLLLMGSFFAAWFTIELAYHLLVVEAAALVAAVAFGGLHGWAGWTGLVCGALGIAGTVAIILRARTTTVTFRESGVEMDLDPEGAPKFPLGHVINPARAFLPRRGVKAVRAVPYGVGWFRKADVFMPSAERAEGELRPGLMQIHGGGWIVGGRGEQGLPLLNHMAAQGWVGFNVSYRLSPFSVWPEHLVDLKHFVAWYREHAEEYGADPDFLCVTGGSAGGHLTAMMALTANKPEFQPGFENTDTTLRAAVPFYGVYDFTHRETWRRPYGINQIVERLIMQRTQKEDPEAYTQASPIAHIRADAPPFLVVHGEADSLIPVAEAHVFVEKLRATSDAPVLYAEMKGGQHAFDIFPSYRTARVVEAVERYLTGLHRQYRQGVRPAVPDEVTESLG